MPVADLGALANDTSPPAAFRAAAAVLVGLDNYLESVPAPKGQSIAPEILELEQHCDKLVDGHGDLPPVLFVRKKNITGGPMAYQIRPDQP